MKEILKSVAIAVVAFAIIATVVAVIDYWLDMWFATSPLAELIYSICVIVTLIAYISHQIYIQKYK